MIDIDVAVRTRVESWDWLDNPKYVAIEGSDIKCFRVGDKFDCKASVDDEEGMEIGFKFGMFDSVEMVEGNKESLMEVDERGRTSILHLFKQQHDCYKDYVEGAPGVTKLSCEIPSR